jgi:hypothetical protein
MRHEARQVPSWLIFDVGQKRMKRASKIFVSDPRGGFAGPFKWTLVREWVAIGLIARDCRVRVDGTSDIVLVKAIEALVTLPESLRRPDSPPLYYCSEGRTRFPSVPRQHSYLRALCCPFPTDHLDKHLSRRLISQLEDAFPERVIEGESDACEDELERQFIDGPATQRQREYLASIGIPVSDRLSKMEASRLIAGPPSEGQLRRLRFYGIQIPPQLSREEASDLIDMYRRENPESEARYQEWKSSQGSASPAGTNQEPSDVSSDTGDGNMEAKPWWRFW